VLLSVNNKASQAGGTSLSKSHQLRDFLFEALFLSRYMPVTPQLSRADTSTGPRVEFLNYNQYLNVVKQQIHFATEIRQILHQVISFDFIIDKTHADKSA